MRPTKRNKLTNREWILTKIFLWIVFDATHTYMYPIYSIVQPCVQIVRRRVPIVTFTTIWCMIHAGTPVELKFDKLKALLRRFKWCVSMLNYYFYWTSRVLHTNALTLRKEFFKYVSLVSVYMQTKRSISGSTITLK